MRNLTIGLWVIGIWGLALPAYAYLDPGTGSVLLQGLLAGIAGGVAILKLYWNRLKAWCSRRPSQVQAEKNISREDNDPTS